MSKIYIPFLLLWIFGFYVTCPTDIIDRYIIIPGKNKETVNRNPCFAAFVISICTLTNMQ